MTLQQVVKSLQAIAMTQHNIRYAGNGDIYADLNANPVLKYDIFYITQNQHQSTEDFDQYGFNIFYITRLENFEGNNTLQAQSHGKELIENVLRIFNDRYDSDVLNNVIWQSFTERFSDLCAGVYAVVTLQVPKDSICID